MKQLDYDDEVTLLLITVTTAVLCSVSLQCDYLFTSCSIDGSQMQSIISQYNCSFSKLVSIAGPSVQTQLQHHLSTILPVICLANKVWNSVQGTAELHSFVWYNHYSMLTNRTRATFPPAIFTMGNQSMVQSKSLNGGNKIKGKYIYS